MKTTIAVIYGGRSGEHEVSLVSAASVARNLDPQKYEVLLIGISKDGRWYLQEESELARCRSGAQSLGLEAAAGRQVAVVPAGASKEGLSCSPRQDPARSGRTRSSRCSTALSGRTARSKDSWRWPGCPTSGRRARKRSGDGQGQGESLWLQAGLPVVPYVAVRETDWAQKDKRRRSSRRRSGISGIPCS
jgi:D-alanine-D-alanine ligase